MNARAPTEPDRSQFQVINLTGRLTRDPELRELPSGQSVCNLRLAVDDMSAGREAGYIDVAQFGKPGEAAAKVLSKGWLVSVTGRLEYRTWQTENDTSRHTYQVIGNVEFLAAPRSASTPSETEQEIAA
jgi:single-strand DNA-binding protein